MMQTPPHSQIDANARTVYCRLEIGFNFTNTNICGILELYHFQAEVVIPCVTRIL